MSLVAVRDLELLLVNALELLRERQSSGPPRWGRAGLTNALHGIVTPS